VPPVDYSAVVSVDDVLSILLFIVDCYTWVSVQVFWESFLV